jgi:hypothetical protein
LQQVLLFWPFGFQNVQHSFSEKAKSVFPLLIKSAEPSASREEERLSSARGLYNVCGHY